jgi:epoxyqueuosine reductase
MNLTLHNIMHLIRDKAGELGFVKTGFARYEVLEDESQKLRAWLDAGKQADMEWIERGFEKRKDVRLILPNAKSVISLAYNYYTPFEHDETKPKISRYAWGKDYHKILKPKLKELSRYIEEVVKINYKTSPNPLLRKEGAQKITEDEGVNIICRAYVDDGPVMDKVWAQKAGIGWMGKHTNVINPEFGSWFFIAEIITNIDFQEYDMPIEDMCGSCSLCISACPTGAITEEYSVEANKCISYQTIENRGEIPESIDLDGWIFGCDVCQDVCPFNSPKYNHVTQEKAFFPKEIALPLVKGEYPQGEGVNITTSPNPLLGKEGAFDSLTEEEFGIVFADSPIKRTKFAGWKRNLNRLKL